MPSTPTPTVPPMSPPPVPKTLDGLTHDGKCLDSGDICFECSIHSTLLREWADRHPAEPPFVPSPLAGSETPRPPVAKYKIETCAVCWDRFEFAKTASPPYVCATCTNIIKHKLGKDEKMADAIRKHIKYVPRGFVIEDGRLKYGRQNWASPTQFTSGSDATFFKFVNEQFVQDSLAGLPEDNDKAVEALYYQTRTWVANVTPRVELGAVFDLYVDYASLKGKTLQEAATLISQGKAFYWHASPESLVKLWEGIEKYKSDGELLDRYRVATDDARKSLAKFKEDYLIQGKAIEASEARVKQLEKELEDLGKSMRSLPEAEVMTPDKLKDFLKPFERLTFANHEADIVNAVRDVFAALANILGSRWTDFVKKDFDRFSFGTTWVSFLAVVGRISGDLLRENLGTTVMVKAPGDAEAKPYTRQIPFDDLFWQLRSPQVVTPLKGSLTMIVSAARRVVLASDDACPDPDAHKAGFKEHQGEVKPSKPFAPSLKSAFTGTVGYVVKAPVRLLKGFIAGAAVGGRAGWDSFKPKELAPDESVGFFRRSLGAVLAVPSAGVTAIYGGVTDTLFPFLGFDMSSRFFRDGEGQGAPRLDSLSDNRSDI